MRRRILKRDGSTFQATTEDFLVARTDDFHPTDVLEDADGSLLVVDTGNWYNLCPSSQVGKTLVKGGVYRIRRKEAVAVKDPRGLALAWDKLTAGELVRLLDDDRFAVRDRAVEQLAKSGAAALASLKNIVAEGAAPRGRRNAVWALTRIEDKEAADRRPSRLGRQRRQCAPSGGSFRRASPRFRGLAASAGTAQERCAAAAPRGGRGSGTPKKQSGGTGSLGRVGRCARPLPRTRPDFQSYRNFRPRRHGAGVKDSRAVVRRGALIALDQMDDGNLTREMVAPLLDPAAPILHNEAMKLLAAHPQWSKGFIEVFRRWLLDDNLEGQSPEELRRLLLAYCKDADLQDLIARACVRDKLPADTRLLLLETIAQAPLDKPPLTWVVELRWALEDKDERVVHQAVADLHIAGVADFDAALLHLAAEKARPATARGMFCRRGGASPTWTRPLFHVLTKCLDKDQPPLLRLAAAGALGHAGLSENQLRDLTTAIAAAGPLETPKLLPAYEKSANAEVGQRLLDALTKSPGLTSLTPDLLTSTLKGYPENVPQKGGRFMRKVGREPREANGPADGVEAAVGLRRRSPRPRTVFRQEGDLFHLPYRAIARRTDRPRPQSHRRQPQRPRSTGGGRFSQRQFRPRLRAVYDHPAQRPSL